MEKRVSTYDYVKDDLRARILSGYLAPGSPLPTPTALADRYGSSRFMLRGILADLQAEGLVDVPGGRIPTTVRARPHDAAWQAAWEATILADRYSLLGCYFTAAKILPPLIIFTARHADTERLRRTYENRALQSEDCLGFLHLMEDLLWTAGEAVRRLVPAFLRHAALPYFWEVDGEIRAACVDLAQEVGKGGRDEYRMNVAMRTVCAHVREIVRSLGEKAGSMPPVREPDVGWVLFPEIEKFSVRVIIDLLIRIGAGGWQRGGMLPPERQLAEHYGVSGSTVRESLFRLQAAGFTKTINGKGTVVVGRGPKSMPVPAAPWLEQILVCALYAGQLTALVMPTCALEAAERTTPEDIRALETTFQRSHLPVRTLFHFVVHRQRLKPMRTILEHAGPLCDWGLHLALAVDRPGTLESLEASAVEMLDLLRAGETDAFSRAMTSLYRAQVRYTRETLAQRYGNETARSSHVP